MTFCEQKLFYSALLSAGKQTLNLKTLKTFLPRGELLLLCQTKLKYGGDLSNNGYMSANEKTKKTKRPHQLLLFLTYFTVFTAVHKLSMQTFTHVAS